MTKTLMQFMRFARAWFTQPTSPAWPAGAQAQAEQVRAMADALRATDPRFAQELYAVAYHHEAMASGAQAA